MIVTKFYKGQGLGNQLWVYSVLRSLAWEKDLEFGIESFKNYKLPNFLPLDPGKKVLGIPHERPYGWKPLGISKVVFETLMEIDDSSIRGSSWEENISQVKNRTKIEGYFQSVRYIENHRQQLMKLLQCKFDVMLSKKKCYINVRGGDFLGNNEICCDQKYYRRAMEEMISYGIRDFAIVTDDVLYARSLLPGIPVVSQDATVKSAGLKGSELESKIARDFSLLQNANYVILSNSTFGWWASWTNLNSPIVIGPTYWSYPRNKFQVWAPKEIAVPSWQYCDGEILMNGEKAVQLAAASWEDLHWHVKVFGDSPHFFLRSLYFFRSIIFAINLRIRNFLSS